MTKPLLTLVAWATSALWTQALVQVDFSHPYTGAPGSIQNTGDITLNFSVDASGNVILDASCVQAGPAAYVDSFDGPVGTVSDAAMYGNSFSIVLFGTGGPLRVDNTGTGLAIQGQNPQLLDKIGEAISANVVVSGTAFDLRSLSYGRATTTPGASMDVDGVSYPLSGPNGELDVSAQGISGNFAISSSSDADSQGFVLTGMAFDLIAGTTPSLGFDNGSGDHLWSTSANWNPDGLPVAPSDAIIDGYDVILDSAVAGSPAELQLLDGSLTLSSAGSVSVKAMEIGRVLESEVRLVMAGSNVSLGHTGSSTTDVFAVGSAGTVETLPDAGGASPLELGTANLTLDLGSQWILDGSQYPGPYSLGDRFVLANYGSLSGSTSGVRTRNFDLPSDRKLQLVSTTTSLYYEVVAQTAATGPNIIIVNVDDMAGGQHFNFEGRDCLTPALDSLASSGIRFTEAFAASTVCGPSRYSLMTSRWPSRNTSEQFIQRYPLGTLGRFAVSDTELEPNGQNLGAWLKLAGYRTGMVGKGHLTDDDLNQTSNWPSKGLLTYPKSADPATDATTNGKMKHNYRVLCQRMRAFGFDYVASYYKANLAELRNDDLNVHNQEWITKGALDFIDENHSERFFLYMAPTINHGPVRSDLTKTLRADVGYTGAGYLPNEDYSFMPARQAIIDEVTTAGKDLISARETWLDYSVAAIINKLTQHGIRNDTLIIFTSDHGEKTLYGPLVWGKSSLFDLGMRVPLVLNWPNGITSPGRSYDEIVSQVDLAPTLLALTGAAGLPTHPLDGVSLESVVNGSSAAVRDDLFCEIGYARAVRTKDRKYVAVRYTPSIYAQIESGYLWERVEGNTATGEFTEPRPYYVNNRQLGSLAANTHPTYFDDDQLYNLSADPNELTNLYGQDPASAYDLKKRLASYIGGIPGRPFRQFSDASTELSPAPTTAPSAPAALQMQFLGLNSLQLNWTDDADSELGYIVEKSVNGGPFQIIDETPSGVTSSTVAVDPGVEDIVLQVSAYNSLGDTAAANPVDLLTPDAWRFRSFGDVDPDLSTTFSQWSTDADGDGQTTLWEYAFGTNPRLASSVARCEGKTTVAGENTFLEYLVPRDARRMVQISGSVSENLSSGWTGEPAYMVVEDEPSHLLFRATAPVEDKARQFIRAEIEEP